jgi:hypothetical protein
LFFVFWAFSGSFYGALWPFFAILLIFNSLWTHTMNRCNFRLTPFLVALAASAALLGLPALAQTGQSTQAAETTSSTEAVKPNIRQFPAKAVRGEMVVLAPPVIGMNGRQARLSVGARIRDVNNHFVLSGALLNRKLVVNYVLDNTGLVHEVWILNAEEAKEKRPGDTGTFFNFITGSDTGTTAPADNGKTPYDQLPAYKR